MPPGYRDCCEKPKTAQPLGIGIEARPAYIRPAALCRRLELDRRQKTDERARGMAAYHRSRAPPHYLPQAVHTVFICNAPLI